MVQDFDERAEIDRLRAENADLRARIGQSALDRPGHVRLRRATMAVLLILAGVAVIGSVVSVWANNMLLNTDRYTETVAPLADEPAIRESISVAAVDSLFQQADVEERVGEALPPEASALTAPLVSQLRSLALNASERALASRQFRQLWVEANRRTHAALVPLLEGQSGARGLVDTQRGTISLDISQIVGNVKTALTERGIDFVGQVPDDALGTQIVLFQSDALATAQSLVAALQGLVVALPVATLVFFGLAIAVAPDRRRAVLWSGVTLLLAMVALGVLLALARSYYLESVDRALLSPAAAGVFFDTMVRFLQNGLRVVATLGVVVLVGAALAGPSRAAVAVRTGSDEGLEHLASAVGLDLDRSSVWVERHRGAIDAVLLVALTVVLFSVETPSPALVLGLAIAGLVIAAIVEVLARAHHASGGGQQAA